MTKKLNILIVDDAKIMRVSLNKSIKSIGHNVVAESGDGESSITAYQKYKPDLVTMDITMQDMNGITALKKIKEINPDVNVIMITSHGDEPMVMNALKLGAKGYILKPITPEKLRESINKIFPVLENEIVD